MTEREKMVEVIARIICENKVYDCLCPEPQNIACTAHCKAVEIVKELIPDGAVVLTKEEYDRFEEIKKDALYKKEEYIKGLMELEKEKQDICKETANKVFDLWANDLRDLLAKNFIDRDVFDECIKYVYDLKSKF